jgi:hypothetical protein
MKKILLLITLSLFTFLNLSNPSYSEEISNTTNSIKIESMIKNKSFLSDIGNLKVQELAINISDEERDDIYSTYEKQVLLPFILNLVPIGIGSLYLGDIYGFAFIYGSMVVGIFVGVFGPLIFLGTKAALPAHIIGIVLASLGSIYNYVGPFTYTNYFNTKLKKALNYEYKKSHILESEKTVKNDFDFDLLSFNF